MKSFVRDVVRFEFRDKAWASGWGSRLGFKTRNWIRGQDRARVLGWVLRLALSLGFGTGDRIGFWGSSWISRRGRDRV